MTDAQPQDSGLVDGPAPRARILLSALPDSRPWMPKFADFLPPGLGSPLEAAPQSPPFLFLEGPGVVQGCGESRRRPSLVSPSAPRTAGIPPGSAHPHTDLLGSRQLPPRPSRATGPPGLGVIGSWQPDQTRTRMRRTSANVGSCPREGHVTREFRTPITTPTSSAAGAGPPLSFPAPSGPATHFLLPIPETEESFSLWLEFAFLRLTGRSCICSLVRWSFLPL